MRSDDLEILRELTDELAFARQFLTEDKNYKKINELNKKIDELEKKLDNLTINIDKDYFNDLKQEIEAKKQEFLLSLEEEIQFFEKKRKEIEKNKDYLINVLEQIKEENNKIKKDISIFNKTHLFFTLLIFTAAAIIGFYLGSKHFINF